MLKIDGKTFMNLQEAVQWLLDNNALPFQCSANYAPNTEIGIGTIVNPSPAKVRIGSLIFFADSKVSTVVGLTENGFICSDQYNDLVDDVVYVSNVALNASGHLIVTLSNGDTIDAGLIKQVSNFTIDASQHLIVNYNDGTNTDLGAIFSGNVNIAGNFTADSIIENMSGYSATVPPNTNWTQEKIYIGVCKNGNKLTLVVAMNLTKNAGASIHPNLAQITIPSAVGEKLYPSQVGIYSFLDNKKLQCWSAHYSCIDALGYIEKTSNTLLKMNLEDVSNFVEGTKYYVRYEATFLLSDSL